MLSDLIFYPAVPALLSDSEILKAYRLKLKSREMVLAFTEEFSESEVWQLTLGLCGVSEIALPSFKNPVQCGRAVLEQEDLAYLLSRLSGLKTLKSAQILPFCYTRLSRGFLPVTGAPEWLSQEQLSEFTLYALSHKLFSYPMLRALFEMLKPQIDAEKLVSSRVYGDFKAETDAFYQENQKNTAFETLTLFISNYHYRDFLAQKKIFLFYENFLDHLRLQTLSRFFEKERLHQIIRRRVEPKKILSFIAKIPQNTLCRAFDALEWENFKPLVSSRTYEGVLEDIWRQYRKEESLPFKQTVLEHLTLWMIYESPPFFFLGRLAHLKESLNLVFDHTGPVLSAVFFKCRPQFKDALAFLTPLRRQFVQALIEGEIQKKAGISAREEKAAEKRFHFFAAAAQVFPEVWFVLNPPF